MPSKVEQDLIGGYFMKIDTLITLHQRELKLKKIKKFMPKNMFD
jgi:restriction endonuclease S subunit